MTPMVSDQRAFCPEGSPAEFAFVVLSAAVSDHVSFEDAGLRKKIHFKRCQTLVECFSDKEQQCSS